MLEKFITIELIRNPLNWVIVFLMIALAGTMLALIVPDPQNAD